MKLKIDGKELVVKVDASDFFEALDRYLDTCEFDVDCDDDDNTLSCDGDDLASEITERLIKDCPDIRYTSTDNIVTLVLQIENEILEEKAAEYKDEDEE